MFKKIAYLLLLPLPLMFASSASHAFTFGEHQVLSSIGERLEIVIPLHGFESIDKSCLFRAESGYNDNKEELIKANVVARGYDESAAIIATTVYPFNEPLGIIRLVANCYHVKGFITKDIRFMVSPKLSSFKNDNLYGDDKELPVVTGERLLPELPSVDQLANPKTLLSNKIIKQDDLKKMSIEQRIEFEQLSTLERKKAEDMELLDMDIKIKEKVVESLREKIRKEKKYNKLGAQIKKTNTVIGDSIDNSDINPKSMLANKVANDNQVEPAYKPLVKLGRAPKGSLQTVTPQLPPEPTKKMHPIVELALKEIKKTRNQVALFFFIGLPSLIIYLMYKPQKKERKKTVRNKEYNEFEQSLTNVYSDEDPYADDDTDNGFAFSNTIMGVEEIDDKNTIEEESFLLDNDSTNTENASNEDGLEFNDNESINSEDDATSYYAEPIEAVYMPDSESETENPNEEDQSASIEIASEINANTNKDDVKIKLSEAEQRLAKLEQEAADKIAKAEAKIAEAAEKILKAEREMIAANERIEKLKIDSDKHNKKASETQVDDISVREGSISYLIANDSADALNEALSSTYLDSPINLDEIPFLDAEKPVDMSTSEEIKEVPLEDLLKESKERQEKFERENPIVPLDQQVINPLAFEFDDIVEKGAKLAKLETKNATTDDDVKEETAVGIDISALVQSIIPEEGKVDISKLIKTTGSQVEDNSFSIISNEIRIHADPKNNESKIDVVELNETMVKHIENRDAK